MPTLNVNGIDFYYELHGADNAPVVVLSNGILAATSSWFNQVPVLKPYFRVLLYDCRGQGQSAHPPGPYTFEQHADDLAALLDRLRIQRAHIAGISYGGEISLTFALRYPARTLSLFVADSASHVDSALATIIAAWRDAATRRDPDLFFNVTTPYNFSPAWMRANPAALAQAHDRYQRLDFPAVARLLTCFLDLNLTERLSEIKAPTCVVVGERDVLKPREFAQMIADAIPNAELHLIRDAGHATFWERPAEFNSILLGFLRKQSRG
ncbi:MAG: alpha/beta fold hydrolase [Anaerolineae bacterium]|nr:alpha/beta fold hydrolase [Anaerolineae bacterium]